MPVSAPTPTGRPTDAAPRLALTGVGKDYTGVRALHDVSFAVAPGEIVGLVGHNGAGKSTVSKILAGLERPTRGRIEIDGHAVTPRNAQEAVRDGVGLVPQRLAVVPTLTVRENMTLGLRTPRADGSVRAQVRETAEALGIEGLLDRRASTLGPAGRRLVMIGRTLLRRPQLLILDEPSAAFSTTEVTRLFSIVRGLRDSGIALIYVSHRLDEVLEISDRVVAFSQGRVIGDLPTASLAKHDLADLIAGRHVERVDRRDARAAGAPAAEGRAQTAALELRGVSVAPKLRDVDLRIEPGEIVGLTGLVGSGRTTLLNALWGVGAPVTGGTIEVGGAPFAPRDPRHAMRAKLAYVPEDRARNSLVATMTVAQNVTLPGVRRHRGRGGLTARRREHAAAGPVLERLRIQPPDAIGRPVSTLSGGNQQKAIIARWLLMDVDVFLFDEPTEGVDIGGRDDIYRMLRELAREGRSVLVSSSDVEEVVDTCDRVLVLRDGTIAEELSGEHQTVERVNRACIS
jgi:ABC-type sugar transport system ATPase subunit